MFIIDTQNILKAKCGYHNERISETSFCIPPLHFSGRYNIHSKYSASDMLTQLYRDTKKTFPIFSLGTI